MLPSISKDNIMVLAGAAAFMTILITVFLYASQDSSSNISKYFVYSSIVIVPFIGIASFILLNGENVSSTISGFIYILLAFIAAIIMLYFYLTLDANAILSVASIANILLTFIVIVGLAIIIYYYTSNLKTSAITSKTARFYTYLFFYIPCLFIELANYLTNEYNMTTKPVIILLIMEIILISLYIYLPNLMNAIFTQSNVILLPNVAWLDLKKEIANTDTLMMQDKYSPLETVFRRNYAISMWIYLNPEPGNYYGYNKETNIFSYGNGIPKITHVNEKTLDNNETVKDKVLVYLTNNPTSSGTPIDIGKQKWVNLVFNYNSSHVDIFLDGNLEKTVDISKNMPIYSPSDLITIGDENGLYGAICNVVYYKNPLSEIMIVNLYNLMMNKNPPTNNL